MLADEEFLTVAEISAILKVTAQTIRNWIDDGKLPAVRIGRRVRVTRFDFNALIESSSPPPPPAPSIWEGEIPEPLTPSGVRAREHKSPSTRSKNRS